MMLNGGKGGRMIYNQQANLPNYGVVWFNLKSIASIISMPEAEHRGLEIIYSPGSSPIKEDA
jgi:hypothetical protein